ncbi:suppressor of fused domain protein [Lysinibacillus xylanilyticus]|uniref:suppressor of fused domain protein n=1 Tax=Lysinibacillus xylanilyticus TaxID=582475 RepID=UPI003814209F
MHNYIEFLEGHLGEIEYGWDKDSEGNKLPFQIVKYKKGPFAGTVTYSTLGLSKQNLVSPISKKEIRQELIFVSYANFGDKNIPGILQNVGLQAINNNIAYLRGDVIGPYGKLFEHSSFEALYASIPVYFPETFQAFKVDGDLPIIQTWLFPITFDEAKFIKENGWDEFENRLVELDPDLVDFKRQNII